MSWIGLFEHVWLCGVWVGVSRHLILSCCVWRSVFVCLGDFWGCLDCLGVLEGVSVSSIHLGMSEVGANSPFLHNPER